MVKTTAGEVACAMVATQQQQDSKGANMKVRTGIVTVPDRHGCKGESWRAPTHVSLTPVFPQREHDKAFFKALDEFLLPLSKNTLGQMQTQGNYRSCRIFDPDNSTEESKLYSIMQMYGFMRTGRGQGVEIGIDVTHQRIKLIWLYNGCELAPDVHFIPLDGGTATTLACLRESQAQNTMRPDMKPYETAMDKSEIGTRARQRLEEDRKKVFKFDDVTRT